MADLCFMHNSGFYDSYTNLLNDIAGKPFEDFAASRGALKMTIKSVIYDKFCSFCYCGGHEIRECTSKKALDASIGTGALGMIWKLYKCKISTKA